MSVLSGIVMKLGFRDVDENMMRVNRIIYSIQSWLDFRHERRRAMIKVREYTHVNYSRLAFLWDMCEKIASSGHTGAFVETGVWRGGSAGVMALVAKKYQYKNKLYFFDSFEGLPYPTSCDGGDTLEFVEHNSKKDTGKSGRVEAGMEYINELFEVLKIDKKSTKIVKGWFQDRLPVYKDKIGNISILRLDGDWYESTKVALENLYDNVESGGIVIIDDYFYWDGCRKAADEFLINRSINVKLVRQGISSAYFVKP